MCDWREWPSSSRGRQTGNQTSESFKLFWFLIRLRRSKISIGWNSGMYLSWKILNNNVFWLRWYDTWQVHNIRESRHSMENTSPWSGPGSRHDDRMEPIWSRLEGENGTRFIAWRKKAGSLKRQILISIFISLVFAYDSIESQMEWINRSEPEMYRRRSNELLLP